MQSYSIRAATAADLEEVRALMFDTVYRDCGTGYVPDWHADIIDPEAFYLTPPRHTLLVAVDEQDGTVAATAALDARGPAHHPRRYGPYGTNSAWTTARCGCSGAGSAGCRTVTRGAPGSPAPMCCPPPSRRSASPCC